MNNTSGGHKLNVLRALYLRDMDLRAALPRIPRLVPEVVTEPFGRDKLLIYGAKDPVVFSTPRGEAALGRLLRMVANTSTEELFASAASNEEDGALFDLVVSLTRAGLLEDEADGQLCATSLGSFFGRYVGAIACNRNRSESISRLSRSRIFCATAGIDATWLKRDLSDSGFGDAFITDDGDTRAHCDYLRGATHALFIANGSDGPPRDTVLYAHKLGKPYLVLRMGLSECQVGPYALPGFTAGYDCLVRTLAAPAGRASSWDARFWAGYAVHMMTTLVAQLIVPQLNQVQRIFPAPGAPREVVVIPMIPGSSTSPLPADPAYESNSVLRKVWTHHVGLRRPPRSLLSPLTHFNHFTPTNIARTKLTPRRYHGRVPIPLPDSQNAAPLPWLGESSVEEYSTPLTIKGLASVLHAMAGYSKAGDAIRRIAPSGGGLESPEIYLYIQGVDGLIEGGYRYFGPDHVLEPLPHLDWDAIKDSLGLASQCAIINVAWFEKVRGKYGDFAYSIVHYDAGVARAFAQQVCEAHGLDVRELAIDPAALSRVLNLAGLDNEYLPTSAFAIGLGVESKQATLAGPLQDLISCSGVYEPVKSSAPLPFRACKHYPQLVARSGLGALDEVLNTRRSVNTFVDEIVPSGVILELLKIASNAELTAQWSGAPRVSVTPLLLRRRGDEILAAGIYMWDAQAAVLRSRKAGLSSEQLGDCINQLGLATASDIVVMLGDVAEAVSRHGESGYRALLLRAGFVVAHMWLAAHAAGLSGTAAGGVLEPGLQVEADCDGYRECPLLSFAMGMGRRLP